MPRMPRMPRLPRRLCDHPMDMHEEKVTLEYLMDVQDGLLNGRVLVNLRGINEAQFLAVMHEYRQTRDANTVFDNIPPGSVSIDLHRDQIETAANAYVWAVARNERASASRAADPHAFAVGHYHLDPREAAHAAIGGNAIPRFLHERYISPQGLTEHGRSELNRRSRAGIQ
jgi:hypothetical protein